MVRILGGFTFVECADDDLFSAPIRIDSLLKTGTMFMPKTFTEEFADGKPRSAGKAVDLSVRSSNVDNSADSFYAKLKTKEENQSEIYVRYVKVLAELLTLHDCETAWNESVDSDIIASTDSTNKKRGTKSAKFVPTSTTDATIIVATADVRSGGVGRNLSAAKGIRFWIKSKLAHNANDLFILLDNSANCASPLESLPIPALEADVWKEVVLVFNDSSALTSIRSLGLYTANSLDTDEEILIDDVRTVAGVVHTLNKVTLSSVTFEKNEAGKYNAVKILGSGFSDTEANLLLTKF